MWCSIYIYLCLIFVSKIYSNPINPLIVQISHGKIRGHTLKSGDGRDFYAFQEIPYAAPPIGNKRFTEPMDPENWSGILNTTKNIKICMQQDTVPENLKITEDCLYLNVYVPANPHQHKEYLLPVLFWIHGGKFLLESGAIEYYNPKYLMDYQIIVVSINYRLGPFGFLATSDGIIPGNLGLKDQLFALKWVHKNIHLFGGDKNSITVMGNSAGAISAAYMQQSQLSKGLVNSYIIISGSSLIPYTHQEQIDYFAFKMGQALDAKFSSKNSTELLDHLQKVSAEEILNANVINDISNQSPLANLIWLPCLENASYNNAFVTTAMLETFIKGDFEKVPMLMGIAAKEALTLIPSLDDLLLVAKTYDKNDRLLISPNVNVSKENHAEAGHLYKRVYTTGTFEKNIDAFIKYLGEDLISTPTIHHAVLVSNYSPVYFFQFSYLGQMGDAPSGSTVPGHAADLHYIFAGKSGLKKVSEEYPEADQLTMKRILKMWTNFVKYKNPTPQKDELLEGIIWPCLKNDNIQYLDINATLRIKKDPKYYKEVASIFYKYSRRPYYVFL